MSGRRGLNLDYAELHRRYMNGESGVTIAKSVDINFSGLYRSWKLRGYPIRSTSDAAKQLFRTDPGRRLTAPAAMQEARRGAIDPIERKERRAKTRQERMLGTSPLEDAVAGILDEAEIGYVRQLAVGPYNVDFALFDTMTVLEIDGGGHNPTVRTKRDIRAADIESRGWRIVHLNRRQARAVADHATSLMEMIRPA